MAHYIGILDGSKDVWGVRIPDVPGCYGGGATPEAAIADAISALREFADHQTAKGITLKAPRTVQAVLRDKDTDFDPAAGEAVVMVPLVLDQARPVKANISLDAGLLEAIDEEAERRGLTRSAFLTSAALDKIGKPEGLPASIERNTELVSRSIARIASRALTMPDRVSERDIRELAASALAQEDQDKLKRKRTPKSGAHKERSK